MDTVIGLLELVAWAVAVLALAAAITFVVIRIGQKRDARKEAAQAVEPPASG